MQVVTKAASIWQDEHRVPAELLFRGRVKVQHVLRLHPQSKHVGEGTAGAGNEILHQAVSVQPRIVAPPELEVKVQMAWVPFSDNLIKMPCKHWQCEQPLPQQVGSARNEAPSPCNTS
jgi:hypothetical protein